MNERPKASVTRRLVAVLLAPVIAAGVAACSSDKTSGGAAGNKVSTSVVPTAVSADRAGLVVGTGPVKVELYSDFLCPICRAFESSARKELQLLLLDKRITLIYRPVAILDRASTNLYPTRSANGAGCASDAGKLMEYVNVLFDNQPAEGGPGPSDDLIVTLAGQAGITGTAFDQCVRTGRYVKWVGQITEAMVARGVEGTPTVFVDGKRLEHPDGARLLAAVNAAAAG
jgi:protein-disulfide isomerase